MPVDSLRTARTTGTVPILAAATFWGLAGGIGGILVERGWDPIVVSFYRGALTLVFAFTWLITTGDNRGLNSWSLWIWSVIAGAGVGGAFSFYFIGMQTGSVAIAATLLYSAPIYVFLGAFMSGRERITFGSAFGLSLIMLGVALLAGIFSKPEIELGASVVMMGLISGLCYAGFIFGFQRAALHGSTQVVMTISFLVETVLLLILAGRGAWPQGIDPIDMALILVLGTLGGGISFLLYIFGLRRSQPGTAAILGMAEPITATLFGFAILNQTLSPKQAIGIVMVIATATAFTLRSQDVAQQDDH
ncbi:DMT family transporter [Salipiger mucosus]|uniref:DMT family transporter n=1 Tax=Salipiger mucosus TaxID=263378 RepID=UPI0003618948|nr:DMT family transporter [Salipiger mucosus]